MIVGEIKNYLRDHGWAVNVPRKIQSNKLAVQRAVDGLRQRLGRAPTIQEIGESTCLTQEEVLDTFELGNCWQSAQVGQIRTREDYYYEELRGSSLRVLL